MNCGMRADRRAPSSTASPRRMPRAAAATSGRFASMPFSRAATSAAGVTERVLGRSQRRVDRPVHQRVQQRPAGPLLAFDPSHVGVDPGQLQLQPQDVLQLSRAPCADSASRARAPATSGRRARGAGAAPGRPGSRRRRCAAPGRRSPGVVPASRPARCPPPRRRPGRARPASPRRGTSVARRPSTSAPRRARTVSTAERPTARTWPPGRAAATPPGCGPRWRGRAPRSRRRRDFVSSATRTMVARRALRASSASSPDAARAWARDEVNERDQTDEGDRSDECHCSAPETDLEMNGWTNETEDRPDPPPIPSPREAGRGLGRGVRQRAGQPSAQRAVGLRSGTRA